MSRSISACGCPVTAFQQMISGKYKLRIMWDLKDGPLRYGEIRSGLLRGADRTQEIAPRVLSRESKALTHSGLIDRKDYGVVPPKVEYRLTRKGQSFIPVIAAIRTCGTRHLSQAGYGEKIDRIAVGQSDDGPAPGAQQRNAMSALGHSGRSRDVRDGSAQRQPAEK
jgi:DNA-binding HxlR family transcriptional regulator